VMPEALEHLAPYVLLVMPWPLVVWSWFQIRRQAPMPTDSFRSSASVGSVSLASVSALLLSSFPVVSHYGPGSAGAQAVLLGFSASVVGVSLALFTTGRLRILLVGASVLLVGLWFMLMGMLL
jgi:hypothetical protein